MVHHLRTLGIVAHIDAGKTTLTERILFDSGAQRVCGEVDDGTATMDWLPQERERGISIVAATTHLPWRGHELQVVDTPGHVDFTAEVERCLRVLDAVVVVLDGTRGVESQTRAVWHEADRWRAARLVFINKMDRAGANCSAALHALAGLFGCRPVLLGVPLHDERGTFAGIGDPVRGSAHWFAGDVPPELHARLAEELRCAHERVVEVCADFDDSILVDFVAGRPVEAARLQAALRRGCIESAIVPVFAGAALLGQGVEQLLDAICDLLPSPMDRDRRGIEQAFPPADPGAPFTALVFKIEHDGGEVRNHVRVFTGALRAGDRVRTARTGALVPVDELWEMHASHHECVLVAGPGAIVVLPGALDLQTGDTLHAEGAPCVLPMPSFSPPVLAVVFEPATPDAMAPLQQALGEIAVDDPTLRIGRDPESGLPLVCGMGELHLEIVASRVRARSQVEFTVSLPRVTGRRSIRRTGRGRARVADPVAAERWAEVAIELAPLPRTDMAAAMPVVDVVAIGADPRSLLVAGHLRTALEQGASLGGAAAFVRATLLGVDSDPASSGDEALLGSAVEVALGKALDAAGILELEPEVEFEVRCPDEHRSPVLADLQARGVSMRQVSSGQLGALLQGRGRLRAFLGYPTRLRSLTRGLGEVQLQPRGLVPIGAAEDSSSSPI